MAMNFVQFQPGLSKVEFMQQYGTEAKCCRALAAGLPLLGLQRTPALPVPWRPADLLPMPRLPAPDDPRQRHDIPGGEATAAHLHAGYPLVDLDQDQHGGAGADATFGGELLWG